MDATKFSFANRCLPLKLANQAGWVIVNGRKVEVTWTGGTDVTDLTVSYFERHPFEDISTVDKDAVSNFGFGILTWRIPFLFRTPAGYNLYVRGPTNWWKDGAIPLDAIVETDWAVSTFTMNWRITRAGTPIRFEKGDPICMVFPYPRGVMERFAPEIRDVEEDPETEREYREWAASRKSFNRNFWSPRGYPRWQKHYYSGITPSGVLFDSHQVKMDIQPVQDKRRRGRANGSLSKAGQNET